MNIKSHFTSNIKLKSFRHLFDMRKWLTSAFGIVALFIVALIPFCFIIVSFNNKTARLNQTTEHLSQMQIRAQRLLETQKEKKHFLSEYKNANRFYIDHTLKTLTFLQSEIDALNIIYAHPAFHSCKNVKDRLHFLLGDDNKLSLKETNHQTSSFIEEVNLKLLKVVEVDMGDVKNILSVTEGVSINFFEPPAFRPQLIIQSFDLQKRRQLERETFFLDLNLVKREVKNNVKGTL